MRRKVIIESSQFSPGSYWSFGFDGYAEDGELEYPDELDELDDEKLMELADNEEQGVSWVVTKTVAVVRS